MALQSVQGASPDWVVPQAGLKVTLPACRREAAVPSVESGGAAPVSGAAQGPSGDTGAARWQVDVTIRAYMMCMKSTNLAATHTYQIHGCGHACVYLLVALPTNALAANNPSAQVFRV